MALPQELIDKIRCTPAGSVSTALDVEVDCAPVRRCGMCGIDATFKTLGDVCATCGHRFDWFQLLSDCGALPASPRTEKGLTAYLRRRAQQQRREDAESDGAWGDPGE